jgi:hypothetical protein
MLKWLLTLGARRVSSAWMTRRCWRGRRKEIMTVETLALLRREEKGGGEGAGGRWWGAVGVKEWTCCDAEDERGFNLEVNDKDGGRWQVNHEGRRVIDAK